MATSVQFRPPNRDLGMVMREVDEDLAIFLGIRSGDKERSDLVQIHNFDGSTSGEPRSSSLPIPNGEGEEAFQFVGDDNLLSLETGKNEHDWLLSQKDVDKQDAAAAANQTGIRSGEGISSDSAANKRPPSSGGRKPASRSSTPTPTAKPKPSRASSRATTPTSSKPTTAQVRSSTSTSTSKPASRSSTPSRSTTPASKTSSAAKPTSRKPATPSTSASEGSRKTAIKNPVSQTLNSRASNPSKMLSVSHNAPQTLKASLPKRAASASRGRPTPPASSKAKPRQKSCSPTKTRAPISAALKNRSTSLSRTRGYNHGDDVNPVLMGTQMVERVVNMRKLAPPKLEQRVSLENPKKSTHDNSGFGRSLSKRSLDMAIRHMDIRRSVSGNLRPVATSVSSYFSGGNHSQSSSSGVSESPITSGSDSSNSSNCVNSYFLDGRQMDD